MADFNTIKQKIQDYLNVYDGKAKPYQEMAGAFERLFHDDFEHTMDDQPIGKDKLRETVKIFVAVGTQAELIFFKPLDDRTFEVKLQVLNELSCLDSTHSKGTIKDGKIVKLEAYDDAKNTYHKWQDILTVKGSTILKIGPCA